MVRVIHRNCNKPAFYFKSRLDIGDIIYASNIIFLDGSTPEPDTPMICGSCNQMILSGELEQEGWTDWFMVEEFHTFENKKG
jgi:hypothetical protein